MSLFSLEYLTTLLVLVFVIGLMLLAAYGIRRTGIAGPTVMRSGERRLSVIEILPVDPRRRLVLVRRDDVEHLLLLGADGERVVESGIDASHRPRPVQTTPTFADTIAKFTGGKPAPSQPDRSGTDAEPNDRP